MTHFIIYLVGAIVALITAIYTVLRINEQITFGDVIGIMFVSSLSWLGFIITLFIFDDVLIYKKK